MAENRFAYRRENNESEIPTQGRIQTLGGRGIVNNNKSASACICRRPKTTIMCTNCGNLMEGRVRLRCPMHDMVTFLCDITNCTNCLAFTYMLKEFDMTE